MSEKPISADATNVTGGIPVSSQIPTNPENPEMEQNDPSPTEADSPESISLENLGNVDPATQEEPGEGEPEEWEPTTTPETPEFQVMSESATALPSENPAFEDDQAYEDEAFEEEHEEGEGEEGEEGEEELDPAASVTSEITSGAEVPNPKSWYVVKVQSGREESIKEAIERRVRKEGLEEFFGQIVIPVERYTEVKTNKQGKRITKTKERKLYPGYLMAEVEYNDRILYLFRETSGVGDFVGGSVNRPPPPMTDKEVRHMIGAPQSPSDQPTIPTKPKGLEMGDRVTLTDGMFKGMEGEVKEILEAVGKVKVELRIFDRPVPVELDYHQIEQA